MLNAIVYAASGAAVGAVAALYVCAILKFKQVERKCLKTCTPIALFAMVMVFLCLYIAQLVILLPTGTAGVVCAALLVILGMRAYSRTWNGVKHWLVKAEPPQLN